MGIYDELSKLSVPSPTPIPDKKPIERIKSKGNEKKTKLTSPVNQSINQSTNRPTHQSIDQSTEPSTNPLTDIDALGAVVDRPRAFYITQKVDRWLDTAVRYLREKGLHKVDRSVLVNALIHDAELYSPDALDKLRDKLLVHLTNRSLRRVQPTD